MNKIISWFLFSCWVVVLTGCVDRSAQEAEMNKISDKVKNHFVPDDRTGIYRINLSFSVDHWKITGETDHPEAVKALLDSIERLEIPYQVDVNMLPDENLSEKIHGLINVSVGNLRSDPGHTAELITQSLLGTPVNILKKKKGWFLIQTPDKYLGWIDPGALVTLNDQQRSEYQNREKIIFKSIHGFSYSMPDTQSDPVSDLVAGNILELVDSTGEYYKILYPDGRTGFIEYHDAEELSAWMDRINPVPDSLVRMSKKLMGIPYLWGGTSVKGFDCSGFVKCVYLMGGIVLPRDASQQAEIGMFVDDNEEFERLEPGDLLFFGTEATDTTSEKIVHVGMWIGNNRFIHASGDVHISSMDPEDRHYDEYNFKRYLKSKRVVKSQDVNRLFVRNYY